MTARTCPLCGATYEGDGRFCPKDGAALRPSTTTGLSNGALVHGRYEIRRELGRGGMGVVYLAEDIRLHRLCALKVLGTGAVPSDAEAMARFYREATNASRISHPHVVAIYNFDETGDGLLYLATEYVEGQSLADRLDEVSLLSPRPTARIVWQIANALDAAHGLKIVHRDLKPGNIMLTRYRQWDDFVKVVDFGIAKAFGTQTGSTITTTGQWVGTPAYMSPEQWVGGSVDHRSDIYSLGLMAVRMLAGGLPPDRGTHGSADLILAALPPNDWPDEVKNVLRRCLSVEPDARFQSATAFSSSLVRAVAAWVPAEPGVREPWEARIELPPTSGGPPGPAIDPAAHGAARRRALSSPLTSVSILLAVIAGIVGLAYFGWFNPSDSDPSTADLEEPAPPTGTAAAEGAVPRDTARGDTTPDAASSVVPAGEPDTAATDRPKALEPAASLERLRALVDLSAPDPDSIRAAVALARRLRAGPLPEEDRLEVSYRLAEATLYLGDQVEGCRILGEIAPEAEASAVFSRAVRALLESSCGTSSR
ncbi:MAG: protein kinase [Gemmatimonadota bacterium]|jgi:serine/threonine-protein kinase